ncbi:MAG: hypothetical protein KG003_03225 [Bacteroidetes bacterium]|nr:hypothetical protein [Bacteroidota bacterium]
MIRKITFLLAIPLLVFGCKKSESLTVDGNTPPDYHSVPTIKVENYVNRLFIDLLGREATNDERNSRTDYLKAEGLSMAAREKIILELQLDTTYHDGDSSYHHAYCQRIYDLSKARFLEGATDGEVGQFIGNLNFAIVVARLDGDSVAVYSYLAEKKRYEDIIHSKRRYRLGQITYADMAVPMIDNAIYDQINMGSFNFVNAAFDDLFTRKPTQEEFNRSYDVIDKNLPRDIFGLTASNKREFLIAMTTTSEFYEAQIRWEYYLLLQREASTQEVINLFNNYSKTKNLAAVQLAILKTDEYAQFLR